MKRVAICIVSTIVVCAVCFYGGAVTSQREVGTIVPYRNGSVCVALDIDREAVLGTYQPRDGRCRTVDWRVKHPFGVRLP